MKSIAEDIATILSTTAGSGLVLGQTLFVSRIPTGPDNCVIVFDVPSGPPDVTLDKASYYQSAFQIYVRNKSYQAGMSAAEALKAILHTKTSVSVESTLYLAITMTTEPFLLEWDDNNRAIINMNFKAQRRLL